MATQKFLAGAAIYGGLGLATAAWTAYKQSNNKGRFMGMSMLPPGGVSLLLQTVLLWPVAVYDNLTKPDPTP